MARVLIAADEDAQGRVGLLRGGEPLRELVVADRFLIEKRQPGLVHGDVEEILLRVRRRGGGGGQVQVKKEALVESVLGILKNA